MSISTPPHDAGIQSLNVVSARSKIPGAGLRRPCPRSMASNESTGTTDISQHKPYCSNIVGDRKTFLTIPSAKHLHFVVSARSKIPGAGLRRPCPRSMASNESTGTTGQTHTASAVPAVRTGRGLDQAKRLCQLCPNTDATGRIPTEKCPNRDETGHKSTKNQTSTRGTAKVEGGKGWKGQN